MKHLTNLNDFKNSKGNKVQETVFAIDDVYRVLPNVDVPKSLINAFTKKVKDETGRDVKDLYGAEQMAEMIVNYIASSYMNIENLPVTMAMGSNYAKGAQVQPQTQQVQQVQQVQPLQDDDGTQAQQTAQDIPAQDDGLQAQGQNLQSQGQQLQQQGQKLQQQGQQLQQGGQEI